MSSAESLPAADGKSPERLRLAEVLPPSPSSRGPEGDQGVTVSRLLEEAVPGSLPGIDHLLHAIRTHLGMEVAFVSEFAFGERIFRNVDAAPGACPVQVGEGAPLEESYCARVVDGRLPGLIRDAAAIPEARTIPATLELPVGAHLSVPIVLSDGTVYGTFCCFSTLPDLSLTDRDFAMMRVFANLTADRIDAEREQSQRQTETVNRLQPVLSGEGLVTVFQPIVELSTGVPAGYEALSRFSPTPVRGPDQWFADAKRVGLEVELDVAALRSVLGHLADLPPRAYLAINVTPSTIASGRLEELCDLFDPARTVLEITEHHVVSSYEDIEAHLGPLRDQGFRLAVDDAGAGYATLQHILKLGPDVIKLDQCLSRGIDKDPSREALVSAMVAFGQQTKATVIAEGVETAEELESLGNLGVGYAQGFYFAVPGPLSERGA